MNIHIKVVPNEEIKERAGFTGADWWIEPNGDIQVRVAQMSSRERETALLVHELVEVLLCKFHGVTVDDVDKFDAIAEAESHKIDAGDLIGCPYGREHTAATACERIVFMELLPNAGSWKDYDDELGAL